MVASISDVGIVLYPDGMIATNISHTDSLSENQWYEKSTS